MVLRCLQLPLLRLPFLSHFQYLLYRHISPFSRLSLRSLDSSLGYIGALQFHVFHPSIFGFGACIHSSMSWSSFLLSVPVFILLPQIHHDLLLPVFSEARRILYYPPSSGCCVSSAMCLSLSGISLPSLLLPGSLSP